MKRESLLERAEGSYGNILRVAEMFDYKISLRESVYLKRKIIELLNHNDSLSSVGSRKMDTVNVYLEAWYDMFIDLYGIDVAAAIQSKIVTEEEIYDMVQRKYRKEQEML